ncbi:hypothetical protein OG352_35955 [Streptomyces sp. NBC_01485]|nr:hypothetical protein [Streptomyces sp. NBC_01485]
MTCSTSGSMPGRPSYGPNAAGPRRTPGCAPNSSRGACGRAPTPPTTDRPPVPGLEQHIWVLEGALDVTAQDVEHHKHVAVG